MEAESFHDRSVGYCTNVHAGATLEQTKENLQHHALAVKAKVSPNEPMNIGLWLSNSAASRVHEGEEIKYFRDWLDERGLCVFTVNGFPYGDFHQKTVKHNVYKPDWFEESRIKYTTTLADILARLSNPGDKRSISTLPIAWKASKPNWKTQTQHCVFLLETIEYLNRLHDNTGCMIHLDLEPEPGCCLNRADEVLCLFEQIEKFNCQQKRLSTELIYKHLRVCHDICHGAVMFENQQQTFTRYRNAGIKIGKVQVSNAILVDFQSLSQSSRMQALRELARFAEDRYLHQTMTDTGSELIFFDDLPVALQQNAIEEHIGDQWRVHYHVPIYLESFGLLQTTQNTIKNCIQLLRNDSVEHWEIETYAWNVLPEQLRHHTLAHGIAQELLWFQSLIENDA